MPHYYGIFNVKCFWKVQVSSEVNFALVNLMTNFQYIQIWGEPRQQKSHAFKGSKVSVTSSPRNLKKMLPYFVTLRVYFYKEKYFREKVSRGFSPDFSPWGYRREDAALSDPHKLWLLTAWMTSFLSYARQHQAPHSIYFSLWDLEIIERIVNSFPS